MGGGFPGNEPVLGDEGVEHRGSDDHELEGEGQGRVNNEEGGGAGVCGDADST